MADEMGIEAPGSTGPAIALAIAPIEVKAPAPAQGEEARGKEGGRQEEAGCRRRRRPSKTAGANAPTTRSAKGKSLVIVESPAKARTLSSILGKRLRRAGLDRPRARPAEVAAWRQRRRRLRAALHRPEGQEGQSSSSSRRLPRTRSRSILATDPDREGEAISWHLLEAMDLATKGYQRVEFHEITADAIHEAFEHPREIDMHLVDAQQGRRVLDRLVGYKISPILWNKIRRGLSAGRVQSPALKMVVDREREIQAFVPQEYWTIDTQLAKQADADEPGVCRAPGRPARDEEGRDRRRRAGAGDHRRPAARGVQRARGEEEAAAAPAFAAVHDEHAAAGSVAPLRLLGQAHDGRRAAAL